MFGMRRILVLLVAGAVAFAIWYKRTGKQEADASAAVLSDALSIVSQIEGYDRNRARMDELVRVAHPDAFRFAYDRGTPGRRFRPGEPATFSDDKYLQWLFLNMERAIRHNLPNLRSEQEMAERKLMTSLQELRKKLGIKGLPGS